MHSLEERENNCVFAIEQIYHKNSFRESKKKKKKKILQQPTLMKIQLYNVMYGIWILNTFPHLRAAYYSL